MIAPRGPERRQSLKICALACGLGDKAVSLHYEHVLRKDPSKIWVERCQTQIGGVLEVLEGERAGITSLWREDRPRRHRGRLRVAVHERGASAIVRCRAISGACRARRALRGACGVQGNSAAADSAKRLTGFSSLSLSLSPCGRGRRHCEEPCDEAIQNLRPGLDLRQDLAFWIASRGSQ